MCVKVALWMAVLVVAVSGTDGQAPRDCHVRTSQVMLGYYDVTCECMQTLQQGVNNLNSLTIDQSACRDLTALKVSWMNIETSNRPRSITFIGAEVSFAEIQRRSWNTSITKIEFRRCVFESIPFRAFDGLHMLRELRFINDYIGKVDSYAIFNLPSLKTVEFADCDIGVLSTSGISGLPALFEFGIVRSNISTIRSQALYNLKTPNLPTNGDCPNINPRQGVERNDSTTISAMARSFESSEELPLPEIGARLLIFRSNITKIDTSAFQSDLLAFVIIAGNRIDYLDQKSFNVELSNQCEISALMIVNNTLINVQSGAMEFASARFRSTHKTFFVMTTNTFDYVSQKGFNLHPSLDIHWHSDNKFVCNCPSFQWTRVNSTSPSQQMFERDLLLNSTCSKQPLKINEFLSTCNTNDFVTRRTTTELPGSYPFGGVTVINLADATTALYPAGNHGYFSSAPTGTPFFWMCTHILLTMLVHFAMR